MPDINVHKISYSITPRPSKYIPEIKLLHYNLLTSITYLPYIDLNSYNFSLKGEKSIWNQLTWWKSCCLFLFVKNVNDGGLSNSPLYCRGLHSSETGPFVLIDYHVKIELNWIMSNYKAVKYNSKEN